MGLLDQLVTFERDERKRLYHYFKTLSQVIRDCPWAHPILRAEREKWDWALNFLEENIDYGSSSGYGAAGAPGMRMSNDTTTTSALYRTSSVSTAIEGARVFLDVGGEGRNDAGESEGGAGRGFGGDEAEGDEAEGDEAEGDEAEGDEAEGDEAEGDEAEGGRDEGEDDDLPLDAPPSGPDVSIAPEDGAVPDGRVHRNTSAVKLRRSATTDSPPPEDLATD